MITGDNYSWYRETYYYLLRELDTVTGIMTDNGALAEGYAYDAYGKVRIWSFRPIDYNRDGDQDDSDYNIWTNDFFNHPVVPPSRPQTDRDSFQHQDGYITISDIAPMFNFYSGSGAPPAELKVSGVGNPYFFTGRRLHFLDTSTTSGGPQEEYSMTGGGVDTESAEPAIEGTTEPSSGLIEPSDDGEMQALLVGGGGTTPTFNRQLQHNRARHYDPHHGRWLQRDPLGSKPLVQMSLGSKSRPTLRKNVTASDQYQDGMNLYEASRSMPTTRTDPSGLKTVCGDWIADGRAQWKLHGMPFILLDQDVELPTPGAGILGLLCETAGAIGALSLATAVPIDRLFMAPGLNTPQDFDGATCYCLWYLWQDCKRCRTTINEGQNGQYRFSFEWQRSKKFCKVGSTRTALVWDGPADRWNFHCPCTGPHGENLAGGNHIPAPAFDEPNRSEWCCPDRPRAKCGGCGPANGGACTECSR